ATRAPVLLVVLPRSRDAEAFVEAVKIWTGPEEVTLFPAWEVVPGEALSPTLETMGRRIKVLRDLAAGTSPRVIVTAVRALVQAVAEPPAGQIELAVGAEVSLDGTVAQLVEYGYERNYLVERPGEFSVRGGILDVFPPDRKDPIRAEFWGDEVSDLRAFAVSSQRSGGHLNRVAVGPCRELRLDEPVRARAAELLERTPEGSELQGDLTRLAEGVAFPGMEGYLALVAGPLRPITELLPPGGRVVVCDPKQVADRCADFLEQASSWGGTESEGLFVPLDDIVASSETVELWPYSRGEEGIDLDVTGWDQHTGRVDALAGALKEVLANQGSVVVAAGLSATRAREILAEAGLGLPIGQPQTGKGVITEYSVGKGFLLNLPETPPVALVGESDLFGRRRPVTAPAGSQAPARATALVLELAADDYVVHDTYGVGKYHGMVTREVAGISRDYLVISYASGDKLYLPTEQLDAITKYTGGEAPKLNRLGTGEWEKSKARARKAVQDIAKDLIRLYSVRMRSQGHPFSPDTPWQTELENAFPHVETPDQLRAIEAVKADMEKPIPMDRLVCGDVGFGKTEVALRAA
ncbi:MAG TPA: CarD family transcriptional regulator, partial [Actinomycetota bacterium]|nr:CarD family transcriptional regulator [Actinomycetota bacterium]